MTIYKRESEKFKIFNTVYKIGTFDTPMQCCVGRFLTNSLKSEHVAFVI